MFETSAGKQKYMGYSQIQLLYSLEHEEGRELR